MSSSRSLGWYSVLVLVFLFVELNLFVFNQNCWLTLFIHDHDNEINYCNLFKYFLLLLFIIQVVMVNSYHIKILIQSIVILLEQYRKLNIMKISKLSTGSKMFHVIDVVIENFIWIELVWVFLYIFLYFRYFFVFSSSILPMYNLF